MWYVRSYRETLFLLLNTQMGSYSLSRWTIHVSLYQHVSWTDHLSTIFHVSTRRSRVSLCRIKEKAIRQADKKGIVREGIFVTTITYCFCSNRTIVYCINKEEKRTHRWNEWFQMNRWITTRFGTESVIQWFIWNHPFHRWERKEWDSDIRDYITLYSVDKWDDLFFIDNGGRGQTISSTVLIWTG